MEIKGLKKAIGDYKRANAGGYYDPRYGYLMYDKSTGAVWTDEFYSIGHNDWKKYESESIIRLDKAMKDSGIDEISMKTVKEYVKANID